MGVEQSKWQDLGQCLDSKLTDSGGHAPKHTEQCSCQHIDRLTSLEEVNWYYGSAMLISFPPAPPQVLWRSNYIFSSLGREVRMLVQNKESKGEHWAENPRWCLPLLEKKNGLVDTSCSGYQIFPSLAARWAWRACTKEEELPPSGIQTGWWPGLTQGHPYTSVLPNSACWSLQISLEICWQI